MADDLIFDPWTPLTFKRPLGNKRIGGRSWEPPQWAEEHRRRLMGYTVLRAFYDNAAREFLDHDDEDAKQDHREYGDAALLVDTILAALVGEDQQVAAAGADDYDPEADPEAGGDPSAVAPDDPDAAAQEQAELRAAAELQEWLQEWATAERLPLKIIETERNAVQMGDGVYTIGWDPDKGRPRLRCWDPGFYFPVLEEGNEDEYPRKVHIAFELPTDEPGKRRIRRITWELAPIQPGDPDDPDGPQEAERLYPWNEEPTNLTCYLSDGEWEIETGTALVDLSDAAATWKEDEDGEIRRRDLMIDFLPVIHIPNTIAISDHFGQSSIARVLQILDDLANADTDLQGNSATVGNPPLVVTGGRMAETPSFRPGDTYEVGEKGRVDLVDTSRALEALTKYTETLKARAAQNARVPEAVLGRIKPSEVPSGVALALSFGPLRAMITHMRLVRQEKYPLLLKFAWRLAVAGGDESAPDTWVDSEVVFGPYLPEDRKALVEEATSLLNAKAISLETALRILQEAGVPIDDAAEEARRVREDDPETAIQLLEATGDPNLARGRLGLDPEPVIPPPVLPTTGLPGEEGV